jgi:class I fructose-bisphosphate aldolase
MSSVKISELLGDKASYYLEHKCTGIPKEDLTLPSPHPIENVWINSNRNNQVLRNLQSLYSHGRLAGTGYLSILPVDQGIEHSAGASFAPNPMYFDPENIVKLAVEAGCSAVASTFGVLGLTSRKYAHKIPYVVKLNHNQLLTYPNKFDQTMFGTVKSAWYMGAVAVGATIYWGSQESDRQLKEVSEAFEQAHELGMATILWCYMRNEAFKVGNVDYDTAALPFRRTSSNKNYPPLMEDIWP